MCRSEEATSNGWPAISARAKSETRPAATLSEAPCILSVIRPAPTAKETAETEAASASARASNHTRRRKGVGAAGAGRDGRRKRRDSVGERARRGLAHSMTADCVAQRSEPTVLGRERGVFAQRAFEFERPHGVELAVESGVKPQEALVSIGHGSALKVLASKARARASRDMTVPIGASVASAISR